MRPILIQVGESKTSYQGQLCTLNRHHRSVGHRVYLQILYSRVYHLRSLKPRI